MATVCALGLGGGAAAFAETAETLPAYPDTFETVPQFESLEDYAVGGGKILFLENNKISEYGGERVITYQSSFKDITNLYFKDDAFYYRTDDNCYYALENFNAAQNPEIENFTSSTKTDKIAQGDYYYHFDADVLYVLAGHDDTPLAGFSNLKQYGDKVYAVKENVLYTLNGTDSAKVKVKDFELTANIAVGGAYDTLTSSVKSDLQFVSLKNDAYMTEVKLDALTKNSTTFPVGDTVKVNAVNASTAFLLYSGEGLSIIAVNGKSYLIHPQNVTLRTVYLPEDLNTEGTATAGYIYSSPYESAGTRIAAMPSRSVTILKEIKKSDYPELDGDFYLIKYEDGENTYSGYVRYGLISKYTFNEDPPTQTPDPNETYEDLIKPVVLILIVLLLIAIAAGYLIYVGTSDKRKKKNEAAATNSDERDKQ